MVNKALDVVVPNFNKKVSGVTATVRRLVPFQSQKISMCVFGDQVADLPSVQSTWWVLRHLARKKTATVWHARRNTEMLLGLLLRDVLGRPLRLLFTSAAQREHSRYTKWLISKMDRVVAPCQASANFLEVPYQVIHHGIDLQEFRFTPRAVRGDFVIAQVGRVREQKGSDLFIDAVLPLLQEYQNLKIKMVGLITPEHQSYADRLKAKIRAAGVEARVEWQSGLAWPELKDLYATVDLLVACPRNEGFGLTPLEAIASGAPVVVNQAGAFAEMVEDGIHGRIVPIDDVVLLREAIVSMLSDPAQRADMAEAAYTRVKQQFSLEQEAQALIGVYRQLLSAA